MTTLKYHPSDFCDEARNRSSWGFLKKMDLNEEVAIAIGRMAVYTMANRIGIKVSVNKNRLTGDLIVKRIK